MMRRVTLMDGSQLELNPKEVVWYYSRVLNISVNATQGEIEQLFNEKAERCRRGGRGGGDVNYWVWDRFNRVWREWVSDPDFIEENCEVMESFRELKKKKKCNQCGEFMIPLAPSTKDLCSRECLETYQTIRMPSMQEINTKLQQTNLDPKTQDWSVNFLPLFDFRCSCAHVPFTPQCQEAPSIQKAIWEHMLSCLKTRERVEWFKDEVLRMIEQAAQNNPERVSSSINRWNTWTSPLTTRTNNSTTTTTTTNHTHSNFENTAYSSSTSSSNNYTSSSENYPSDNSSSSSSSSSRSYSSSPSDSNNYYNSATSTASETKESKTNSSSNSPSRSADNSSSASSGYISGGSGSSITPKPEKESEASQTTSEPTKPTSSSPAQPSSSEQSNLINQTELTQQKQQIIEQIQEQLSQLPNLNLNELANWKQEIIQSQSLEAITAYQKNLSERIEKEKQLKQNIVVDSTKESKDNKPIIWAMGIGALFLAGGLIKYLFWKKKVK